jgi:hypothetical protein
MSDFGPCRVCGGATTLYFYPRVGPAPGNMLVCQNSECVGSVEGIRRAQAQQLRDFSASQKARERKHASAKS